MSIPTPQHIVLMRGDTRDITLTMPDGATLLSATSVRFSARRQTTADTAVWAKTITPSSDTVAVASLTTDDWTTWESMGEPQRMDWDFEVVASGDTTTVARGTIAVVWDVTRSA